MAEVLSRQGILPGIKVDNGAKPLAGAPEERITEGLDGLRDRLKAYREIGARFAKWRAVIAVSDTLPSATCVNVNAHALARYAALCQEQNVVPIVEPEVLMDGSHTIERCEEVTGAVLHAVFNALLIRGSLSRACCSGRTWSSRGRNAPSRPRSRRSRRHTAVSSPTCAGGRTRNRVPVRRQDHLAPPASERDQSARGTEALEAQFFIRAALQDEALKPGAARTTSKQASRHSITAPSATARLPWAICRRHGKRICADLTNGASNTRRA